jgi:Tol biopolymer transport system component
LTAAIRVRGYCWFIALTACGRIDFAPLGDGDTGSACTLTSWAPPRRLDAASDAGDDYAPAIAPNGLAIVFEAVRPPPGLSDLYITTRPTTTDDFGAATLITDVSTATDDYGPMWSPDGTLLYFRRGGSGNFVATYRGGAAFDPPQPSDLYGEHGAISRDELEMFVTKYIATTDLAYARRDQIGGTWVASDPYGGLNTPLGEGFPSFDDDRQTLYFEQELASGRLVIATSTRGGPGESFGAKTLVPELDVAGASDGDPDISRDGRTLVFSSDRAGVSFDLFITTRTCVAN